MGFVKNLAKGFVQSAVNQVGRDCGKVVSNNVYGDAHSTPPRIVSNKTSDIPDVNSDMTTVSTSLVAISFRLLLAFLFNVIGCIVLFIYGMNKMSKKNYIKVFKYEQQPTYKRDNRYRNGLKYDGTIIVKRTLFIPASDNEVIRNEKIANIYIYGSIGIFAFFILTIFFAR
ncbi:MAG: hypothetical protein KA955_08595 [Prevotella sp.]|jgi:hypothetical protein|nr:hypothetical protein [Prevotella sp.]